MTRNTIQITAMLHSNPNHAEPGHRPQPPPESKPDLGAGALAVPVYWATNNPYAAHNAVLLLSFVLSATGTYYLVKYLVAMVAPPSWPRSALRIVRTFFAHTPHIQLLMTAGLPFSLLALHRLVDRPSARRGFALGITMVAQALFCGYYGSSWR